MTDEGAGIDVDGGHRLGLVDNQVAAGLQLYLAFQRLLDLVLDTIEIEDRPLARIVLDARGNARHEGLRELDCLLRCFARVDTHLFHVATDEVAQHAQHQRQVGIDLRPRRGRGGAVLELAPYLVQELHVATQGVVFDRLGHGTHDVTVIATQLGGDTFDDALKALTFGIVFDTRGNADILRTGHEHEVT